MNITNTNLCTICLENNDNVLIFPCNCKNPIHIDCLIKWISYKKKTNCEICKIEYKIPNDILRECLEKCDIEEQISNNYEESDNYHQAIYDQLIRDRNNIHNKEICSNITMCAIILGIWFLCVFSTL